MSKRARHFGTVRKLPSGRFQALYWQDGTRHARMFLRKADATAHLATVEADMLRGDWADPRAGLVHFHDYAERWLTSRPRPLRETTLAKYRYLLDKHILPTFGASSFAKITPSQVAEWYAALHRQHASTAAGAYRLLAAICNTAVAEGKVPRSPCQVEGGSREHAPERPVATPGELQRAVDAAPANVRCALLLAAWGQLRRGEVLGLQRGDIDSTAGTLRVQRGWSMTSDGKRVLGAPKTEAGQRVLHLPPHVADAVRDHLDRFVAPESAAWLFPSDRRDEPMHPRTFSRVWDRARTAAGRPDLHFHDLRHSGLTWVAQSGAGLAELMRRGGHKSPAAAIRYQHAADERDKAIAEALGKLSTV